MKEDKPEKPKALKKRDDEHEGRLGNAVDADIGDDGLRCAIESYLAEYAFSN
jgi:hypothetical protein